MIGWFSLAAIEWSYVLGSTPLEVTATVCSVLGVFLIARQNVWGWPLGIAWAGISAYLAFVQWQLVSDGILYATYIPIQMYCWAVWVRRGGAGVETPFVPTWLPRGTQAVLAAAAVAGVSVWAFGVSSLAERVAWIPAPALLVRDSATTVLNYFAQFLQARKRMENWVGWLIVNLLGIHIYWVKESPIYSVQYAFFLVLGLYGWWKWNQSIRAAREASVPA
ncbi:MAG: nicotinamide mononucleotide transporter [Lentisphaerae bacterium]|nr:nicotinamide mononucleotide transporter [Lentisphaerota bacterium]